jgi:hypothetical protein
MSDACLQLACVTPETPSLFSIHPGATPRVRTGRFVANYQINEPSVQAACVAQSIWYPALMLSPHYFLPSFLAISHFLDLQWTSSNIEALNGRNSRRTLYALVGFFQSPLSGMKLVNGPISWQVGFFMMPWLALSADSSQSFSTKGRNQLRIFRLQTNF